MEQMKLSHAKVKPLKLVNIGDRVVIRDGVRPGICQKSAVPTASDVMIRRTTVETEHEYVTHLC